MQVNNDTNKKRPVRLDTKTLPKLMTKAQAQAYGDSHMRSQLKQQGCTTEVLVSSKAVHGSLHYRICYRQL